MGWRLYSYIGALSDWELAFILRSIPAGVPMTTTEGGWAIFASIRDATEHVRKYNGWIEWEVSRCFPIP